MPEIFVNVAEKTAEAIGQPTVICGNSDYTVQFTFDSEWDDEPVKVMRVIDNRDGLLRYTDVLFVGNSAPLPVIYRSAQIAIGVYAGNIRTTTPARIPCAECITDSEPEHPVPQPDVYTQLLDYLKALEYGDPFAVSDVLPISNGGVSDDIIAIAEEE